MDVNADDEKDSEMKARMETDLHDITTEWLEHIPLPDLFRRAWMAGYQACLDDWGKK